MPLFSVPFLFLLFFARTSPLPLSVFKKFLLLILSLSRSLLFFHQNEPSYASKTSVRAKESHRLKEVGERKNAVGSDGTKKK